MQVALCPICDVEFEHGMIQCPNCETIFDWKDEVKK